VHFEKVEAEVTVEHECRWRVEPKSPAGQAEGQFSHLAPLFFHTPLSPTQSLYFPATLLIERELKYSLCPSLLLHLPNSCTPSTYIVDELNTSIKPLTNVTWPWLRLTYGM
jgi:hypothetical protein